MFRIFLLSCVCVCALASPIPQDVDHGEKSSVVQSGVKTQHAMSESGMQLISSSENLENEQNVEPVGEIVQSDSKVDSIQEIQEIVAQPDIDPVVQHEPTPVEEPATEKKSDVEVFPTDQEVQEVVQVNKEETLQEKSNPENPTALSESVGEPAKQETELKTQVEKEIIAVEKSEPFVKESIENQEVKEVVVTEEQNTEAKISPPEENVLDSAKIAIESPPEEQVVSEEKPQPEKKDSTTKEKVEKNTAVIEESPSHVDQPQTDAKASVEKEEKKEVKEEKPKEEKEVKEENTKEENEVKEEKAKEEKEVKGEKAKEEKTGPKNPPQENIVVVEEVEPEVNEVKSVENKEVAAADNSPPNNQEIVAVNEPDSEFREAIIDGKIELNTPLENETPIVDATAVEVKEKAKVSSPPEEEIVPVENIVPEVESQPEEKKVIPQEKVVAETTEEEKVTQDDDGNVVKKSKPDIEAEYKPEEQIAEKIQNVVHDNEVSVKEAAINKNVARSELLTDGTVDTVVDSTVVDISPQVDDTKTPTSKDSHIIVVKKVVRYDSKQKETAINIDEPVSADISETVDNIISEKIPKTEIVGSRSEEVSIVSNKKTAETDLSNKETVAAVESVDTEVKQTEEKTENVAINVVNESIDKPTNEKIKTESIKKEEAPTENTVVEVQKQSPEKVEVSEVASHKNIQKADSSAATEKDNQLPAKAGNPNENDIGNKLRQETNVVDVHYESSDKNPAKEKENVPSKDKDVVYKSETEKISVKTEIKKGQTIKSEKQDSAPEEINAEQKVEKQSIEFRTTDGVSVNAQNKITDEPTDLKIVANKDSLVVEQPAEIKEASLPELPVVDEIKIIDKTVEIVDEQITKTQQTEKIITTENSEVSSAPKKEPEAYEKISESVPPPEKILADSKVSEEEKPLNTFKSVEVDSASKDNIVPSTNDKKIDENQHSVNEEPIVVKSNEKFVEAAQPSNEESPVIESVVEPVVETEDKSADEPVAESVVEQVVETVVEQAIEPVVESLDQRIVEPAVEPVVEPVVEPAVEAAIEPAVEHLVEPVHRIDPEVPDDNIKVEVLVEHSEPEIPSSQAEVPTPVKSSVRYDGNSGRAEVSVSENIKTEVSEKTVDNSNSEVIESKKQEESKIAAVEKDTPSEESAQNIEKEDVAVTKTEVVVEKQPEQEVAPSEIISNKQKNKVEKVAEIIQAVKIEPIDVPEEQEKSADQIFAILVEETVKEKEPIVQEPEGKPIQPESHQTDDSIQLPEKDSPSNKPVVDIQSDQTVEKQKITEEEPKQTEVIVPEEVIRKEIVKIIPQEVKESVNIAPEASAIVESKSEPDIMLRQPRPHFIQRIPSIEDRLLERKINKINEERRAYHKRRIFRPIRLTKPHRPIRIIDPVVPRPHKVQKLYRKSFTQSAQDLGLKPLSKRAFERFYENNNQRFLRHRRA